MKKMTLLAKFLVVILLLGAKSMVASDLTPLEPPTENGIIESYTNAFYTPTAIQENSDREEAPCFHVRRLECAAKGSYNFEIVVYGESSCHWPAALSIPVGSGFLFNVQYQSGIFPPSLIITGSFIPAAGVDEFCYEVNFKKCSPCRGDVKECVPLPHCGGCEITNGEFIYLPKCVSAGDQFCIKYSFDYEGQADCPIEWSSGNGLFDLTFSQSTVDPGNPNAVNGNNIWELCFDYLGECGPQTQVPLEVNAEICGEECQIDDFAPLDCCDRPCTPYKWGFEKVECHVSPNGCERFHTFNLIVYGVGSAGLPSTVTFNSTSPPLFGQSIIDGNLVINGAVFGEAPFTNFCADIDFENPEICDITGACVTLPYCCQDLKYSVPQLTCADEGYDFCITIQDYCDESGDATIFATCGDVTNVTVNDLGNDVEICGTIINVTAEPGDECWISVVFDNNALCSFRVPTIIPTCECVDDIVGTWPECIAPNSTFEVTYTFTYYGPPTTGVTSYWGASSNNSDLSLVSPAPGESVPISEGANTITLTFEFTGENCSEDFQINLFSQFFAGAGICCSISESVVVECCCLDLSLVHCSYEETVIDYLKKNYGDSRDEKMQSYLSRVEDCVYQDKSADMVEAQDSCCPICDPETGYEGGIWVTDEQGNILDYGNYSFQWTQNGDPYGGNGPYVYGSAFYTYAVTVTNLDNGCTVVLSDYIDCGNIGIASDDHEVAEQRSGDQKEVDQQLSDMLLLTPNPASDQITLTGNAIKEGRSLNVIDITGKAVFELSVLQDGIMSFNIRHLPEGTYLIQIVGSENQILQTEKMIIQH